MLKTRFNVTTEALLPGINLIEANATGQFGNLVEAAVHQKFNKRLLKYNGRPFFTEDVENFIKKNK